MSVSDNTILCFECLTTWVLSHRSVLRQSVIVEQHWKTDTGVLWSGHYSTPHCHSWASRHH